MRKNKKQNIDYIIKSSRFNINYNSYTPSIIVPEYIEQKQNLLKQKEFDYIKQLHHAINNKPKEIYKVKSEIHKHLPDKNEQVQLQPNIITKPKPKKHKRKNYFFAPPYDYIKDNYVFFKRKK